MRDGLKKTNAMAMNAPRAGSKLHKYVVLETIDFEKAASLLNRTQTPHSFDLIGKPPFYTRIKHVDLSVSSITLTTTRGHVRVTVGPDTASYILWFDLDGMSQRRVHYREPVADCHQLVLHSPGSVTDILTGDYLEDFGVTIDQGAIQEELENQLGRPVTKTLQFEAYLSPHAITAGVVRRRVTEICRILDGGSLPRNEVRPRLLELERSLVSLLVSSHGHNYTRLLNRKCHSGTGQVRLAEDFIRAHADLPLTIGDLARLAGVSARTLEYGFRKHRGQSPMQFLRQVRLENARADLQNPARTGTVSSVAAKWGFLHFSRFAAEYNRRFAELPSTTLRRRARLHRV